MSQARAVCVQFGVALMLASSCDGLPAQDDVEGKTSALAGDGVGPVTGCQDCLPYTGVVKLSKNQNTFCSGGKVGTRRILTSARCLSDNAFPAAINVTNIHEVNNMGTAMNIVRTYIHPTFSGTTAGSDIALVETSADLISASGSPMLSIPVDSDPFPANNIGHLHAYGGGPFNGVKQVDQVNTIPSGLSRYIAESDTSVLAGDFGGMFITEFGKIAGVISSPGVAGNLIARTQLVRPWILASAPTIPTSPVGAQGKMLISKTTGKCVQANSGSSVSEVFCTGVPSQRWIVDGVSPPGGPIQLRSEATNMCLGRSGSAAAQMVCTTSGNSAKWGMSPGVSGPAAPNALSNAGSLGGDLIPTTTTTLGFGTSGGGDIRRWWFYN